MHAIEQNLVRGVGSWNAFAEVKMFALKEFEIQQEELH